MNAGAFLLTSFTVSLFFAPLFRPFHLDDQFCRKLVQYLISFKSISLPANLQAGA
jgi:hypothetical protein